MTTPPPGPPRPSTAEQQPGVTAPKDPPRPGDPTVLNGATVHGVVGRRGVRHPWELRLLGVGVALAIIGYLAWIALIGTTLYLWVAEGQATVDTLWQYVGILPFFVQLAVLLPLAPIIYWWIRATMYAQLRTERGADEPHPVPRGLPDGGRGRPAVRDAARAGRLRAAGQRRRSTPSPPATASGASS